VVKVWVTFTLFLIFTTTGVSQCTWIPAIFRSHPPRLISKCPGKGVSKDLIFFAFSVASHRFIGSSKILKRKQRRMHFHRRNHFCDRLRDPPPPPPGPSSARTSTTSWQWRTTRSRAASPRTSSRREPPPSKGCTEIRENEGRDVPPPQKH